MNTAKPAAADVPQAQVITPDRLFELLQPTLAAAVAHEVKRQLSREADAVSPVSARVPADYEPLRDASALGVNLTATFGLLEDLEMLLMTTNDDVGRVSEYLGADPFGSPKTPAMPEGPGTIRELHRKILRLCDLAHRIIGQNRSAMQSLGVTPSTPPTAAKY